MVTILKRSQPVEGEPGLEFGGDENGAPVRGSIHLGTGLPAGSQVEVTGGGERLAQFQRAAGASGGGPPDGIEGEAQDGRVKGKGQGEDNPFAVVVQISAEDPGHIERRSVAGFEGGEIPDHENLFARVKGQGREGEGDPVGEAQSGEIEDHRSGVSEFNEFVWYAALGFVHDLGNAEVPQEGESIVETGDARLPFAAVFESTGRKGEVTKSRDGGIPASL